MSSYKGYFGVYALCTNARGKLNSKGELVCNCSVRRGFAAGINNGQYFKPVTVNNNRVITSLYSGINGRFLTKQNCNSGTWGDCLNKKCVIDSKNPNRAWCFCSPQTVSPWITFQRKSNPNPCPCDNLSGALNPAYESINTFYNSLTIRPKPYIIIPIGKVVKVKML